MFPENLGLRKGYVLRMGAAIVGLSALLVLAARLTPFGTAVGNWISMLDRNGFFVPEDSSVWSFRETVSDSGSGGYWLYGEDAAAFYAAETRGGVERYSRITRRAAAEVDGFEPHDFETWRHYTTLPCGDVLAIYAEPVEGLEFLSCDRPEDSQTVISARYRVPGARAKAVETALLQRFGMGALVWACCGYETRSYGGFEHDRLRQLHPFLSVSISMAGAGAGSGSDGQEMPVLDFDQIEYFYVTVDISLV